MITIFTDISSVAPVTGACDAATTTSTCGDIISHHVMVGSASVLVLLPALTLLGNDEPEPETTN